MVFDTWVSVFLVYVALPLWFYVFNKKAEGVSNDDRRMILLGLALVLGALTG